MTTTIIDKPIQDALWPDGERMPVSLAVMLGKANRIADAGADFLAAADKLLAKDDGPMGREAKALYDAEEQARQAITAGARCAWLLQHPSSQQEPSTVEVHAVD